MGRKNPRSMRATSTLHPLGDWHGSSVACVWEVATPRCLHHSLSLCKHTFMACQREVMMFYWKYEFRAHGDRARQTEQETQN